MALVGSQDWGRRRARGGRGGGENGRFSLGKYDREGKDSGGASLYFNGSRRGGGERAHSWGEKTQSTSLTLWVKKGAILN